MSHYLHSALDELGRLMEANRPPPLRLNYALCGRRRGFLSLSDAHRYEDGFYAHERGEKCPEFGPGRDGWCDSQEAVNEAAYQFRAGGSATWWVRPNVLGNLTEPPVEVDAAANSETER